MGLVQTLTSPAFWALLLARALLLSLLSLASLSLSLSPAPPSASEQGNKSSDENTSDIYVHLITFIRSSRLKHRVTHFKPTHDKEYGEVLE